MNAAGAAILANPHPSSHIVYPYTDKDLVGQAVCLFASAGLRDHEGVVLIMTKDHCEPFKLRLQLEGFDVEALERSGQLTCVTSEELLSQFMRSRSLNEELFRSTIRTLVRRAKASVTKGSRPRRVRVFGEMVSQLRHSDLTATAKLEQLWDEAIKEHSVALLCTYALCKPDDYLPDALLALHTHDIARKKAA